MGKITLSIDGRVKSGKVKHLLLQIGGCGIGYLPTLCVCDSMFLVYCPQEAGQKHAFV